MRHLPMLALALALAACSGIDFGSFSPANSFDGPLYRTDDISPSKREIRRYQNDSCSKRCATRRATSDKAAERASRRYDEWLSRPADVPRR